MTDRIHVLYLIVSVTLHLFIFYWIYIFFSDTISFTHIEEKPFTISITSDFSKSKDFNSGTEKLQNSFSGFKNLIENEIEIESAPSGFNPHKTEPEYTKSNARPGEYHSRPDNVPYSNNELPLIEPEWVIDQGDDKGLLFSDGSGRKLILYDKSKFSELKLKTSTEIYIHITITPEGYIENAILEQSTGETLSDELILDTIGSWRFEKGPITQKGKIKLNYFLQ